jgi:hypothetical protein
MKWYVFSYESLTNTPQTAPSAISIAKKHLSLDYLLEQIR